jgi:hypothetical protein
MSGPTIRINDGAFPEVSAISDLGTSLEITDINDFDLGLLGNQRKLATPPQASPAFGGAGSMGGGGGGLTELGSGDIEFVSLDDNAISYDVKPITGPSTSDTIRIMRDGPAPAPARPIEAMPTLNLNGPSSSVAAAPAPAAPSAPKTSGWFSSLNPFGGSSSAPAPASSGGGGGWFGAGSSSSTAVTAEQPKEYLTPEQELAKKTEGLTLLERMDRKGVGGTKMTIANTLDEINAEVARRKDSKGLEASIRFQRSMLTTVTSGMEFLNSKYDPLGVALDGWSEQVNENIEDYDEIFEELYDKYKDKSKVAPEVRLIMSLGLSAAMCHVTNTMFKSKMPGMDDLLKRNPDLARQMAKAAAEQAVGPGFANFVSMGMPSTGSVGAGPASRVPAPMPSNPSMMMEEDDRPMMPPMGGGIGGPIPSMDPRGGLDLGGAGAATARREMRGPTGMDDILQQINMNARGPSGRAMPPPAMDMEDGGSVGSGITSATDRRNGISRRRKVATQPTGATLTINV